MQGKGEYTMEYKTHMPVMQSVQQELVKQFALEKANKKKQSA